MRDQRVRELQCPREQCRSAVDVLGGKMPSFLIAKTVPNATLLEHPTLDAPPGDAKTC